MTVGQLLDQIRDTYQTQFRRSLSEVQEAGLKAWAEPAIRNKEGALAREGSLNLPMRMDLVGVSDSEVKERFQVDSNSKLSFEPIDFEWSGGLSVRLAPFHWDACQVRVSGSPKAEDWSHLRTWFERWFDCEDAHQADQHGLYGVVHFLSDPKHDEEVTFFEVDFGSAPVEAFEEFLDALRDSGATKVEIGV